MPITQDDALFSLTNRGFDRDFARSVLQGLQDCGYGFVDQGRGEFVCRWVNVRERSVPPDADTIIRTVTRTSNAGSESSTHWLEGIIAPPFAP
jgi:hypothetical protein